MDTSRWANGHDTIREAAGSVSDGIMRIVIYPHDESRKRVPLISKDAKLWVLDLSRKLKNLWYKSGHTTQSEEYKRTYLVAS